MRVRLWDRQERDFKGWEWPVDQNGNQIEWQTPWLYLFGSTGSGKTSYARWWVQQWDRWEFTNVNQFIDHLRAAAGNRSREASDTITSCIRRLSTQRRMVIDDLGRETDDHFNCYGTKYTPSEIFETALDRRHEAGLRTLITTNLSPFPKREGKASSLERQYGPQIHSRVMEIATVYNIKGDRRKEEDVTLELRHQPKARSNIPLLPEAEDALYEVEKPMTERQWQTAIRKAPAKIKPYMMKWHALWKKEKEAAK